MHFKEAIEFLTTCTCIWTDKAPMELQCIGTHLATCALMNWTLLVFLVFYLHIMGFPSLYFVFFTLYLSIILTYTTGSAADPQASTCSTSAANWRFPLVHDDRLTCLYTRDEELEFQREAASNAVIRSLEDKVVRLQQIVDDLQQWVPRDTPKQTSLSLEFLPFCSLSSS